MLFLLPALLVLRRDLAIALAILIARYNPYVWWVSIAVAAAALAASNRFPALRARVPPGNQTVGFWPRRSSTGPTSLEPPM
jgi:hypothetical protein